MSVYNVGELYGAIDVALFVLIIGGLIIAVMLAAGYDTLVGIAVVMLGAGIGVLASTVNPFATGVASNS